MSERCTHGMIKAYCSSCKREEQKLAIALVMKNATANPVEVLVEKSSVKNDQPRTTAQTLVQAPQRPTILGDYIVFSVKYAKDASYLSSLSERITFVHLHGHPYLWVLKLLVEKLPNLRQLRVIPTMEAKFGVQHRKVLAEKDIKLITGHERPGLAWKEGENRSVSYDKQRKFLLTLSGNIKILFDELIKYGFETALMTSRYFCLNGEKFIGQREIGAMNGITCLGANGLVSRKINSVLHYLDPVQFKVSEDSIRSAGAMKEKVSYLKRVTAEEDSLKRALKEIGLEKLPEGMPLSYLPDLKAVYTVKLTGRRFEDTKIADPRGYRVIALRYGIEDGKFRTLEEIGQIFDGLTRERIRQIEERFLTSLGINLD